MKAVDKNGRLFGKFSVIDVLALAVVLVMAAALYGKYHRDTPMVGNASPQAVIRYQVMTEGSRHWLREAIQVGDQLYDQERDSGGSLGKVVKIEVLPGSRPAELDDGSYEVVPMEDRENLLLTVEGSGMVSEGRYILNGIYYLGVNSSRNLYTKCAQFSATVVSILDQEGKS